MINPIENINWVTTNALRNTVFPIPKEILPLNALIGLKDDNNKAGYILDAVRVANTTNANYFPYAQHLVRSVMRLFTRNVIVYRGIKQQLPPKMRVVMQ